MQNGRPWQRYSGVEIKHTFRNLLRKEKWTVVAIPAIVEDIYLQSVYLQSARYETAKNDEAYVLMRTWCEQTFDPGMFASTMNSQYGSDKPRLKRFAFKNPSDATYFRLKWS